jgi:hypothetical protein
MRIDSAIMYRTNMIENSKMENVIICQNAMKMFHFRFATTHLYDLYMQCKIQEYKNSSKEYEGNTML